MAENLTMSQMAKELKLSRRVVSAVVNDNLGAIRVSDETRKRIKEHLRDRGYVQSKSALQLRNQDRVDTINLLYCGKFIDVDHLFSALGLMVADIKKTQGLVNICGVDVDNVQQSIEEYVAQGVRRLIWVHVNIPEEEIGNAEKLFPLLRRMEQVVIYNYDFVDEHLTEKYLHEGIHLVGFDREGAYRKVAEIFAAQGHKSIALSDVWSGSGQYMPGNLALERVFNDYDMDVIGIHPLEYANDLEKYDMMFKQLVAVHKRKNVSCVFIRNQRASAIIVDKLIAAGIRVPEDLAVISFGDNYYTPCLKVPMTTFAQPVEAMCAKTIELVRSADKHASSHIFPCEFMARQSHLIK